MIVEFQNRESHPYSILAQQSKILKQQTTRRKGEVRYLTSFYQAQVTQRTVILPEILNLNLI